MNFHAQNEPHDMKHSSYYHSYFEGYTEARVPDSNRRRYKMARVYTSDYIVPVCGRLRVRKLGYISLYLAGAVLFLLSAIPSSISNKQWFVEVPTAASFLLLFLTGVVLVFFLGTPSKMTLYQYSFSNKLKLITGFTSIALGFIIVGTIAALILVENAVNGQSVLSLLGYFVSFICFLLLNRLENNNHYKRLKNTNTAPREGNVIC